MKTAFSIAWRFLTHSKGQSILIAIGIAVGALADLISEFDEHLLRALLAESDDLGEVVQIALADSTLERLARRTA